EALFQLSLGTGPLPVLRDRQRAHPLVPGQVTDVVVAARGILRPVFEEASAAPVARALLADIRGDLVAGVSCPPGADAVLAATSPGCSPRPGCGKEARMRIFVIGPMRPTRDGQGIELATRTSVIKRGVEEIVRQKALSQAHVKAPDDLRGSTIATDVFAQLDAADLVVADLSACSPNVLYELAFVDSLGLPTVLVC